jgi:hypothetical protein
VSRASKVFKVFKVFKVSKVSLEKTVLMARESLLAELRGRFLLRLPALTMQPLG